MRVNTLISMLTTLKCAEMHTRKWMPIIARRSVLSFSLFETDTRQLLVFPEELVPGIFGTVPLPSPFESFLDVRVGEDGRPRLFPCVFCQGRA